MILISDILTFPMVLHFIDFFFELQAPSVHIGAIFKIRCILWNFRSLRIDNRASIKKYWCSHLNRFSKQEDSYWDMMCIFSEYLCLLPFSYPVFLNTNPYVKICLPTVAKCYDSLETFQEHAPMGLKIVVCSLVNSWSHVYISLENESAIISSCILYYTIFVTNGTLGLLPFYMQMGQQGHLKNTNNLRTLLRKKCGWCC